MASALSTIRRLFTSAVLLMLASPLFAAVAAPLYTFVPSGHDGGGGQSAIACDPYNPGNLIAGGDIWGLHRSTNYGRDWTPVNVPASGSIFSDTRNFKTAAVKYSLKYQNHVYACIGRVAGGVAGGGGFALSTDGGQTWTLQSSKPQFGGSNDNAPLNANGHPRSVGNLIALDSTTSDTQILYVGTYSQGVMRSSDEGKTWKTIAIPGLNPAYIRGIAMSDLDPTVLYVATWDTDSGNPANQSIFEIDNAPNATTATLIPTPFAKAEELVVCNGDLYVAANTDGVYQMTHTDGQWHQSYSDSGASLFYSIDGYYDAGTSQAIVYASTATARNVPGSSYLNYSVIRSTDSGANWTCITADEAKLHTNMPMGDASGDIWWHSVGDASAILGGGSFVACQTLIDPLDHKRLYVVGRAGPWRTDDATVASPDWYPCMRHLNATVDNGIVADPNVAANAYCLDFDWTFLYSTDTFSHVTQKNTNLGNGEEWCLAVDSTTNPGSTSSVYMGRGVALAYLSDPVAGSWVDTNLNVDNVKGCVVKKTTAGTAILAAVANNGIYRKIGAGAAGTWGNVYSSDNVMQNPSTKKVSMAWGAGASQVVYLQDRQNGVYHSLDDGASWSIVTPPVGGWDGSDYSGTVVIDPTDDSVCYVSGINGVWVSTNANTASPDFSSVTIAGLTGTPGFVVYDDDGNLYLNTAVTSSAGPKLFFKAHGSSSWSLIATDPIFQSQCGFIEQMDVGPKPDHTLFFCGNFTGVTVGLQQQMGSLKATLLPPEVVVGGAGWRIVGAPDWNASDQTVSVAAGSYDVEFEPVTGWVTPQTQNVTVVAGQLTTASAAYVQASARTWMIYR